MSKPDTILDDAASTLDEIYARHLDEDKGYTTWRETPAELLADGWATTFPIRLYGYEFTVLATAMNHGHKGVTLRAALYHPDVELETLDDTTVSETTHLKSKTLYSADIADVEVQDDIAHLLATMIGYFVRYLLDGRNFGGYTPTEDDDPEIDEAAL
jgi:hypothetical protein